MNSAYIYLQIYRMFDRHTPLPVDCGNYCGSACCKGDEESGMYLFPGEKAVFDLIKPDGMAVTDSGFEYEFGGRLHHAPILICGGRCDRSFRPLACRIFPLTPVLDENDNLIIINDPRAKKLCPLTDALSPDEYDAGFVRSVRRAFMILKRNKHVHAFLREYTDYINEYNRFFN